MNIITDLNEMRQTALALRREGRRIGFVPTMGNLHEGHLSLMRIAREHADVVVTSIYVNPTQFGPGEDFERYPRTPEEDEKTCREETVDIVFRPPEDRVYEAHHSVYVDESEGTNQLEGASRPGHFRGVLTIVAKLFNLVLPDVAVFGQKDAQQLYMVRKLVRDLNIPAKIISGPIVREPDGLALSSRNVYLSASERKDALCLRRALDRMEELHASGEREVSRLKRAATEMVDAAAEAKLDYVEVVSEDRFAPVERVETPCVAVIAARVGLPRLIDNTLIPAR